MRRITLTCALSFLLLTLATAAWQSTAARARNQSPAAPAVSKAHKHAVKMTRAKKMKKSKKITKMGRVARTRTSAASATTTSGPYLLGDLSVEPTLDNNTAGSAEAFPFTGHAAGTIKSLSVYIDSLSKATRLIVGLYANNNNHPGTLLTSGSLASPKAGGWNTVSLAATPVSAGVKYWVAVLGAGGVVYFRDRDGGPCNSENSRQTTLSSMPTNWSTGPAWDTCPVSAYAVAPSTPAPPPVDQLPPTVTGTTIAGDTLTTTNGTWAGAPTSYGYKWEDCDPSGGSCSNISGATSQSYRLGSIDVGHTVRSVVTATNASGSTAALSAVTNMVSAPPPPSAPTNTAAPAIGGTANQGNILATSNGSWTGSPTSYSYQWQDCNSTGSTCATISGAAASSYTLTSNDVGHTIRAIVSASNSGGSASQTTSQTTAVSGSTPAPPMAAFTFSPTSPVTGQAVAFSGTGAACQATPCSYSWSDNPPGGGTWPLGTGQTLSFTFQGAGTKYVTLTVTDALNRTSNVERDVVVGTASAPSPPSNTAAPAISGTTQQGQTLTTTNGSWSGSPTSYRYQWQDCDSTGSTCANVSGAAASSYTLTSNDVGHIIRAIVTATNSGGTTGATSAATAAVTGLATTPPSNTAVPAVSGTTTQGQTLSTTDGAWTNSPTSYSYQWQGCDTSGASCTNISGATHTTYTLASNDVGHTIRAIVTATNSGGSNTASSAASSIVAASGSTPGAAVVGTGGAPTPSCTVTASSVSAALSDLSSASAGSTVCLSSGTYGAVSVTSNITPASNVTFAAQTPGAVTIAGIATHATVNNLTIEGFKFSDCLCITDTGNHITAKYNTLQNFSNYAIQGCPACTNAPNDLSNFDIEYNQIDHTAYCLRGAANSWSTWTFSHNVCGPGIGQGGNVDDHYIQAECINGLTVDNNAFVGPFNATALAAGAHNNVMHSCGSNLKFDNNIVWHADSRAQTVLWGDDGNVSTGEATNNLFVEDPTCGSTCPAISMWLDGNGSGHSDSNVTWSSNTIVGSGMAQPVTGGMLSRSAGITGFTAQNNISVNNNSAGVGDFSLGSCSVCSGNVSQNGSGNTTWAPSWQTTSWTPTSGSPWTPPPAGYYKPTGSASLGYQGSVGP